MVTVSFHHDFRQDLPLRDNMLICIECGHRQPMSNPPVEVFCKPKWESSGSGYSDSTALAVSVGIIPALTFIRKPAQ